MERASAPAATDEPEREVIPGRDGAGGPIALWHRSTCPADPSPQTAQTSAYVIAARATRVFPCYACSKPCYPLPFRLLFLGRNFAPLTLSLPNQLKIQRLLRFG